MHPEIPPYKASLNAPPCTICFRYYMYRCIFLFLLVLTPGKIFCQVSGRILDSGSREPLEGAIVQDGMGYTSVTGREGMFTIEKDTAKIHSLFITCPGYQRKHIILSAGKQGITIELQPVFRNIGEVVVTSPAFSSRLNFSSGATAILPASLIGQDNGVSLSSSLNKLPGVYMAAGTYSTNRLIIRGIGSRTPYSTNRIRAYYGDIPLTSGDGTTTIEDIDAAAAGRIEVIRGPASAIYGSGLGGVLKIFPGYPSAEGMNTSLTSEAGSFGTFRNVISSGFKNSRFSTQVVYSNTESHGYRENSRYGRNSFYSASYIPGKKNDINILLLYTGIQAQIPSSIDKTAFTQHPASAAPSWLDVKGHEEDRRFRAGVTLNRHFTGHLTNKFTIFSSLAGHYESRPFNILSDASLSAGIREMLQGRAGKIRWNAGTEMYTENYNWQIYGTLSGKQGKLQHDYAENRSYLNVFSHAEFPVSQNTRFETGLNLNLLRYALTDKFTAENNRKGSYMYNPVLSPYAGINYHPAEGIFIYASAGHGFSAPSLEETLLPQGIINPDLKPEEGWNYDMGTRGDLFSGRLFYDLCLYYMRLNNLLITKRLSEDTFTGINAGKTGHAGIEIFLRAEVIPGNGDENAALTLGTSLTLSRNHFIDFTDDGKDYSGNILPGIPGNIFNIYLNWKTPSGLESFISLNRTGSQFMNDRNDGVYGSYESLDLKVSWHMPVLRQRIKLFAGIRNLLNEKYASMILVNALSTGGNSPRYYYPGEPFNFYFGLKFTM